MPPMPPENSTVTLPNNRHAKRSWGLRVVCLILLGVGAVNLVRAGRAVILAPEYAALNVQFPVWLIVFSGVVWGIVFGWLALRMWQRRNLTARGVFLLVGAYGLFQVIWWRVFAAADYALDRWPFATALVALFAGGLSWFSARQLRRNMPAQGAPGGSGIRAPIITDNEGINR